MKYEAILFDMDGTIVDSEPLHEKAFEDTFRDFGITMTHSDFVAHIVGKTDEDGLRDYLQHIGESITTQEFIENKVVAFEELASEALESYPGVIELVRELSYQVPLALVTNSNGIEAKTVLDTFDIDDCFDIVVTNDDVDEGKPNPEGYLRAARLLNKDPKSCVVVEDTPTGVAAANEAGIDCIAVTNTHSEAELSQATRIVDTLDVALF